MLWWDSIKFENVDLGAIKEYRSVIEICSELHDFQIYHYFLLVSFLILLNLEEIQWLYHEPLNEITCVATRK